jgi:hypothetical protein
MRMHTTHTTVTVHARRRTVLHSPQVQKPVSSKGPNPEARACMHACIHMDGGQTRQEIFSPVMLWALATLSTAAAAPTRCRHCHSSAIHQIAASGKRRRRRAGTSEAVTRPPPRQTDTRTHLTSRTSTVYGRSLVRSYCSRSTLRSPGHSRELRRTVRTQKSRHRGSVLCFGTTRNSANGSQRQYYSSLYK